MRTVDIANASYALMLRLLAYSYVLPHANGEKGLAVRLSIELMRAVTMLGNAPRACRPGPPHPGCNAGMSFTTLRDTAPLPPGLAARFYFMERFEEIAAATAGLSQSDPRAAAAARITASLAKRASKSFAELTRSSATSRGPARWRATSCWSGAAIHMEEVGPAG